MYAKLFSSLLSSSVWSEDSDTCKVWITMIALADREGFVFGSPSGIARICALPVEKVEAAIEKFLSPDQHSSDKTREPDRDGRRVEVVDGGWVLLNYAHYRDLSDAEVRRSQYRSSKRRIRGLSKNVHAGQHRSTRVHPSESESSSEADTESSSDTESTPSGVRRFAPPTLEETKSFFESEHLGGSAEAFFYHFSESEWRRGNGKPVRSWQLTARKWGANEARYATAKQPATPGAPSVAPSGDYRLPTGGYAAADLSWFDHKGERYYRGTTGAYRTTEGYAPDGSHKQNTGWGPKPQEIVDRILGQIPKATP